MTAAATEAAVEAALLARWPENRLEPSLDRIAALMEALGQPQRRLPVIHVTGTNGKTTTARVIDSILRACGLRVGRYTSPHLESVRERIVLDGEPLDPLRFTGIHERLRSALAEVDAASEVPLSFFEVLTAMAFVAFADAGVDAAVIEVGMGGTWDATNVADGRVAVVTPVGLDHTEYLGPDEVAIAREKAGIIKPGATAVVAPQSVEVMQVLLDRAAAVGASVVRCGREVRIAGRAVVPDGQSLHLQGLRGEYSGLFLPLLGVHQAVNALTGLAAVEAFLGAGAAPDPDVVRRALRDVRAPGRLELVRAAPPVLVDASHNPHGMGVTVAAVREAFGDARVLAVVAALEGKDAVGMLRALDGLRADVVVTRNGSPRAVPAEGLAAVARDILGPGRVSVVPELPAALDAAMRWAGEPGADGGRRLVLVTGSVVTAGEARALLRG